MTESVGMDESVGLEDIDCEDFLEIVYGDRQGWIDLPALVNGYWVPYYVEWPNENDAEVTRRIDSSLRDDENLYYSVAMFSSRGRKIEDTLPCAWLWADLDETHPTEAARMGFLPTVAVESSPNRYQALWRLDRDLRPASLSKLNRGLTYALGADRGGYDLTQVLRIPGTRNFKYDGAPPVRLLWYKPELSYDPRRIWARVKDAVGGEEALRGALSVVLPRRPISARARTLLRAGVGDVVTGERSARLWELECLLAEAGLEEEEIYDLCVECAWNKWKGIASGRTRLTRDIRKAMAHVARKSSSAKQATPAPSSAPSGADDSDDLSEVEADGSAPSGAGEDEALPWVGYSSFMAMTMREAKWLVRDIWTADSHGIIGGEPKTSKTTLALALALSVASGKPFMGEYPVGVTGPVLMVQEENAPWMMQDRLRKLASYYGLLSAREVHVRPAGAGALGSVSVDLDFPRDVPLKILNNYGFDLAVEEHRDMLVAEIEATKPRLLVLDPLYLILGGADENRSTELRPFLKWLLQLRYQYNMAIMVVHHFRKQGQNSPIVRPGQRILGSATLHGWVDSALYASAAEARVLGQTSVVVEREFRSMAPQRPLAFKFEMGEPGSLEMKATITKYDQLTAASSKPLKDMVKAVDVRPGIPLNDLADVFDLDRREVYQICKTAGLVIKAGGKGRGNKTSVWPKGTDA